MQQWLLCRTVNLYIPVTADLVLSWNGPRTVSGSLFWSGGLKQALPDLVLGPFQAAQFGPTLLILVLYWQRISAKFQEGKQDWWWTNWMYKYTDKLWWSTHKKVVFLLVELLLQSRASTTKPFFFVFMNTEAGIVSRFVVPFKTTVTSCHLICHLPLLTCSCNKRTSIVLGCMVVEHSFP